MPECLTSQFNKDCPEEVRAEPSLGQKLGFEFRKRDTTQLKYQIIWWRLKADKKQEVKKETNKTLSNTLRQTNTLLLPAELLARIFSPACYKDGNRVSERALFLYHMPDWFVSDKCTTGTTCTVEAESPTDHRRKLLLEVGHGHGTVAPRGGWTR